MFNTDSLITTIKDDLLNRDKFAKQLAQAILSYNQSNSFNIGLYGEWGSGKTSVINMVEESIFLFHGANVCFIFTEWGEIKDVKPAEYKR